MFAIPRTWVLSIGRSPSNAFSFSVPEIRLATACRLATTLHNQVGCPMFAFPRTWVLSIGRSPSNAFSFFVPEPVLVLRFATASRPATTLHNQVGCPMFAFPRTWVLSIGRSPSNAFSFYVPELWLSPDLKAFERIHFRPRYAGANLGHPSLKSMEATRNQLCCRRSRAQISLGTQVRTGAPCSRFRVHGFSRSGEALPMLLALRA